MRKINGVPVEASTDLSSLTGGEVLKWDADNSRMAWEDQDATGYIPRVYFGGRGVFGGGYGGGGCGRNPNGGGNAYMNNIEYITISTTGNASDFGDLTTARGTMAGMSGAGRGIFTNGNTGTQGTTIDYITVATAGNATDFGDVNNTGTNSKASSNGIRGLIWAGGYSCTKYNQIDYITIATTGNATDFGDKLTEIASTGGALGSETRGLHAGGWYCFTTIRSIDYVAYDTLGNAADFGDLHWEQSNMATVSDGTRGVWCGSSYSGSPYNYGGMEYVTIATTGNTTDFGDLTTTASCGGSHSGAAGAAGANNSTRGCIAGGYAYYCARSDIDYITIQTTGNASSFGSLTSCREGAAGCSGD